MRQSILGLVILCLVSCCGCASRAENEANLDYLAGFYRARTTGDLGGIRASFAEMPHPTARIDAYMGFLASMDSTLGRPDTWSILGFAQSSHSDGPRRFDFTVGVRTTSGTEYFEQFAIESGDGLKPRISDHRVSGLPDSLVPQLWPRPAGTGD